MKQGERDSSTPQKRVRVMPQRAATELEINSLDVVSDSIRFWSGRLRKLACPECDIVGSLEVRPLNYGIVVECARGQCGYEREVPFQ